MSKILVVDDDRAIGSMLEEYFTQHGFVVFVADSVSEANDRLATMTPDLALVDRNLGEADGLKIVEALVDHSGVPVIIMSGAKIKESDKVEGLELGASDYVSKPFSLRELLARARAAMRPASPRTSSTKVFRFEGWRLSLKSRRLTDPTGAEVKLSTNEFNLLVAMLEGAGEVLSREQLVRATRIHDQEITDRSVDVTVLRVRRKLSRGCSNWDYIKTQRGIGYRFDCSVSVEIAARSK